MDAVAYFKAYERMCDSFDSKNNITGKPCVGCPLDDIGRGCHMNDLTNNAEECVAAVEKWAKEHPVKTRQSEFLKIFPSAQIEDETVSICPAKLNVAPHATNMGRTCIYVHDCAECRKCKRDFWLTEISEREADKNAPEAITRCRDCRYSSRDKETNQTWCNYSTERMETSVNWSCHHRKRREG